MAHHWQREYVVTMRGGTTITLVASSAEAARAIAGHDGKVKAVAPGKRVSPWRP